MASIHEVRKNENAPRAFRLTRGFSEEDSLVPVTKRLLGGKGVGLAEAAALDLPVPPGFTITTEAWHTYQERKEVSGPMWKEILLQLSELENMTSKTLGNPDHPLFVSVRSGSPVSMPGILKTILNVGINDATVGALEKEIGSADAWEAYFRLIVDLATVSMGMPQEVFENLKQKGQYSLGVSDITKLPAGTLRSMVNEAKEILREHGHPFPDDPTKQIRLAIAGVFASWDTPEAALYRDRFAIAHDMGTAVNIQTMVWGNSMKEHAGAGVLFNRNPLHLYPGPWVAFAPHAQGTAVVGDEAWQSLQPLSSLPLPTDAQSTLKNWGDMLAANVGRPVEIEFTHDGSRVWFLQFREARLSDPAWLRFLLEKVRAGDMSEREAQHAMMPEQMQLLILPDLDPAYTRGATILSRGIPIVMGNASGLPEADMDLVHQNPDEDFLAVQPLVNRNELISLPPNVKGLIAGNGGGASHIAGVASRIGVPVIFSADINRIPLDRSITMDATRALVYEGILPRLENGKNKLVTDEERATVEAWLALRKRNPWKFLTNPHEDIDAYTQTVRRTVEGGKVMFQSPKAIEAKTVNTVIPQHIRMDYTVLPVDAHKVIRAKLRKIVLSGHDATVRTCFRESRRGPWAVITNEAGVDEFLTNPNYTEKYGGYPRWVTQEGLTEVLIGDIPKDKLNERLAHEHATWTLSALKTGEVLLQINPFTAMLRGFEEEQGNNHLITIRARFRPKHPDELKVVDQQVGDDIFQNPRAHQFGDYITQIVLRDWWKEHHLAARLAAITEVFPETMYVTPVLEGQARMDMGGALLWCLVYGMKIDPA